MSPNRTTIITILGWGFPAGIQNPGCAVGPSRRRRRAFPVPECGTSIRGDMRCAPVRRQWIRIFGRNFPGDPAYLKWKQRYRAAGPARPQDEDTFAALCGLDRDTAPFMSGPANLPVFMARVRNMTSGLTISRDRVAFAGPAWRSRHPCENISCWLILSREAVAEECRPGPVSVRGAPVGSAAFAYPLASLVCGCAGPGIMITTRFGSMKPREVNQLSEESNP